MNRQRKVVITTTYNEMGMIINTRAEELDLSAQPVVKDANVGDINKFIDGLEEIFADIRERQVDDSVCGLCEYDGAYIGQSGDWCNECPGFDRDDCFKLSDECRKRWIDTIIKALPSAQPEYEELTSEEAASEIASGNIMSAWYWLDAMIQLKQMGYAICRKR